MATYVVAIHEVLISRTRDCVNWLQPPAHVLRYRPLSPRFGRGPVSLLVSTDGMWKDKEMYV